MPITIYDYDFKNLDLPLFYNRIKDLNILIDLGDQFRFRLPDTDYYIFLTFSSFVWVYYPESGEPEILDVEEILDRLPENKVIDILFNLDLFVCSRKIRKEN